MGNLQLVRVDSTYSRSVNLEVSLQVTRGLRLAGIESLPFLPFEVRKKLSNQPIHDCEIIISREHVRENMPEMDFRIAVNPFLKLVGDGKYVTYTHIHKRVALQKGNWLLCTECQFPNHSSQEPEEPARLSPSCGTEFKCHVNFERDLRWRTRYSAYVNLDRTSDNIGGSSWDGNLTRYFQAGFTTRVQYGVRAGLFPQE